MTEQQAATNLYLIRLAEGGERVGAVETGERHHAIVLGEEPGRPGVVADPVVHQVVELHQTRLRREVDDVVQVVEGVALQAGLIHL